MDEIGNFAGRPCHPATAYELCKATRKANEADEAFNHLSCGAVPQEMPTHMARHDKRKLNVNYFISYPIFATDMLSYYSEEIFRLASHCVSPNMINSIHNTTVDLSSIEFLTGSI